MEVIPRLEADLSGHGFQNGNPQAVIRLFKGVIGFSGPEKINFRGPIRLRVGDVQFHIHRAALGNPVLQHLVNQFLAANPQPVGSLTVDPVLFSKGLDVAMQPHQVELLTVNLEAEILDLLDKIQYQF